LPPAYSPHDTILVSLLCAANASSLEYTAITLEFKLPDTALELPPLDEVVGQVIRLPSLFKAA
jgi:hypothetical protein